MISHKEKVILFGLGKWRYTPAEHYLQTYNADGHVLFIVDNDPELHGEFCGIPVCPQSALTQYAGDGSVTVVITAVRRRLEIRDALTGMGFQERDIVIAMDDADFYLSCVARFYKRCYDLSNIVPTRAYIELSRGCNCRCIYCPLHGAGALELEKTGFMDWKTAKEIARQIANVPTITACTFCGKGEPYLHPEWYEMIDYILQNSNIRNVTIYSNGMLLDQETVHKLGRLHCDALEIEVSVDGESPEENDQYRVGSDYAVIKKNIEYAVRYLPEERVTFYILNTHPVSEAFLAENNYTVTRDLQVPAFLRRDFSDKINKECRITSMYAKDTYSANGVTLRRERVKRRDIVYPPCIVPFNEVSFTFSGDVVTCGCSAGSHIKPIGNVLDGDSLELWVRGRTMQGFREMLMDGKIPGRCAQCTSSSGTELDIALKI